MVNICYIQPSREDTAQPYLSMLRGVISKSVRSDTKVTIKSLEPGLPRILDSQISYYVLLNKVQVVEKVMQAEKEGFDVAIVGMWLDRGLREARELVNIPVIGPGEASMLFACSLGEKFGVVTLNHPKSVLEAEALIRLYGLQQRAIANPVRRVSISLYDTFTKGIEQPKLVGDAVLEKARECVADGADVVVIGCTGLGPLSTTAGVNKLSEPEVPVLDPIPIALKAAEAIVDLRSRLGLPSVSRAGDYARPREKDLKRLRVAIGLETGPSAGQ